MYISNIHTALNANLVMNMHTIMKEMILIFFLKSDMFELVHEIVIA